jgi:hypothetical protein
MAAPDVVFGTSVRETYRTVEGIVKLLLLPLLGLIIWVGLVREFTKFSSTDALLVVLAFSVWHCTRWLGQHLDNRLSSVEAYVVRAVFQTAPGATRLELRREAGTAYTVLSTTEPDAPKIVDQHGRASK